jgi:hypothetical protein
MREPFEYNLFRPGKVFFDCPLPLLRRPAAIILTPRRCFSHEGTRRVTKKNGWKLAIAIVFKHFLAFGTGVLSCGTKALPGGTNVVLAATSVETIVPGVGENSRGFGEISRGFRENSRDFGEISRSPGEICFFFLFGISCFEFPPKGVRGYSIYEAKKR